MWLHCFFVHPKGVWPFSVDFKILIDYLITRQFSSDYHKIQSFILNAIFPHLVDEESIFKIEYIKKYQYVALLTITCYPLSCFILHPL